MSYSFYSYLFRWYQWKLAKALIYQLNKKGGNYSAPFIYYG